MPGHATGGRFSHGVVEAEVPIHYAELPADRPPMVLLHGIGMDWRVWQAISRRLEPEFHLYFLDLRGHGGSGKPERGYTLPAYAADVEDVLDALALTEVVLVGSSLGGAVALAVEAPGDIVSHRVLVDPPLTGGPVRDPEMFADILRLKHEPEERLAAYLGTRNPGAGQFLLRAMSAMWHQAADGVILDLLARRDEYFALDAALPATESPTLLMRADPARGGTLTEAEAKRTVALLPRGECVFMPGAGHAIHATKPAEFTRRLLDFVSR